MGAGKDPVAGSSGLGDGDVATVLQYAREQAGVPPTP